MPSAKELREIAKDLGLRGYSKMNKTQLTESIEGHVKTSKDLVAKSTPKEESTEAPAPVKQKRKSNSPWVSFCRDYAKEHGVTYKEAMTKRSEYDSWRSSKKEPESLPPVEESE
jgi:hypothetical protein|tara:strand:+ start:377 stop:718 length:342 start_codon:yes stop_codon:yes gene_type:complete